MGLLGIVLSHLTLEGGCEFLRRRKVAVDQKLSLQDRKSQFDLIQATAVFGHVVESQPTARTAQKGPPGHTATDNAVEVTEAHTSHAL